MARKKFLETSSTPVLKRMAIREGYTEKGTVVETAISTWTTPRKIKMQRWIAMCCKGALSTP
jgi:hypothetical protein